MTLTRVLGLVRWYLRELTGEAGYDRYVERHRRTHPREPALSRREYERHRASRLDENPGTRCC
ncbi:YbdD/YjiX family protein [Nonomuraea muscovyensis]|uniref:Uncharacterized short protein YbdD (DUF466 family) n=1 Tax=Nonomuraea muscovyensis TaxID=1124761 RepID=A0A7X0F2S3_9ACTN|nr:YbdD/YjiX family protein [Nonomuraea muscovyensis]MBB6351035.1 uncharacterized short protein YbdD (DUF466 family) [Nonomuraea muscovyensis]